MWHGCKLRGEVNGYVFLGYGPVLVMSWVGPRKPNQLRYLWGIRQGVHQHRGYRIRPCDWRGCSRDLDSLQHRVVGPAQGASPLANLRILNLPLDKRHRPDLQ